MSELDKILKELEENKKRIAEIEKKGIENPEQFLKEIGLDINNLNVDSLKIFASNLNEQLNTLENAYKTKTFKNTINFHTNKLKNNPEPNESDKKKFEELGKVAFSTDFKNKTQTCFIGIDCDKQISDAHSIQENGQLSLISENKKVFHFVTDPQSNKKEITEIQIKNASVFKGFCKTHDNKIFETIDKNKTTSDIEKHFLYSLRSFAFSYHNVRSFQSYFSNQANDLTSSVNPIIDKLKNNDTINQLMNAFGFNDLMKELNKENVPKITEEQKQTLEIIRFEKQRQLLLNYIDKKIYDQLEYLIYEKDFLCPIACSSWMITHIDIGNSFIVNSDRETPYYGIPIIISVLPVAKKTKIVLARFKEDESGSELVFNLWRKLFSDNTEFEKEISKLIIENVENFYLSPHFWNKLNEQEKKIILNALSVDKKQFPENRTEFEIINFFDYKYNIPAK